ncbi:SDR family NAD(P)-dependent oxidoreductase, partial [Streptomyces sp. NPDC001250]|uniref:SDR family NAD(P)-dependent oxidoreductase n=1 Tax=Streptomyces sp. NPDC001250 TaxID=3154382 RepID=UPI0033293AC5
GPGSVVVSGLESEAVRIKAYFGAEGRKATRLTVSHAFHSPLMEPMLDGFRAVAREVSYGAPSVPVVSTLTGTVVSGELSDPEYWVRHVREAVRFADAVRVLADKGVTTFVELGPDAVLTAMGRQAGQGGEDSEFIPTLRRGHEEAAAVVQAVAHAHCRGTGVDWAAFFAGRGARRVDLPTYAFQRSWFWRDPEGTVTSVIAPVTPDAADTAAWNALEHTDADTLAARLGVPAPALGDVLPALAHWRRRQREEIRTDTWCYRVDWQPVPVDTDHRPTAEGTWLLAVPATHADDPRVRVLAEELAARGQETVRLEVAEPDRAALADRLRTYTRVTGVLSLLALDDRPHPVLRSVSYGTACTATLAQALNDAETPAPLWCVTFRAAAVGDGETAEPAQAAVWGMGAALALETPETWGGVVDVPDTVDAQTARLLCAALTTDGEDQLAVRDGRVLARRMVRSPLAEHPAVRDWQPRGTILVTGGTGGIGAQVARVLSSRGVGHLLLTSRRGPDAEGTAELVAELAAQGTPVTVEACDIADRDAVRRLLASVPADRPVTAVVHAAGVMQRIAPLPELSLAEFAAVADAKVAGARHLDELLGDRSLDAFVLFSSGAAVWGSTGQAAYGSANAALDALAHARRARGATATSIAWGPWDTGMVDAELADALDRIGTPPMASSPALEALCRILDRDLTHLVVADLDWARFAPVYAMARPRPLIAALPEARAAVAPRASATGPGQDHTDLAQRLKAMPRAQQDRITLELVRTHVAQLLGYDSPTALDPARTFTDLGFDSVAAVDLKTVLSAATGLELPATVVFDHATPALLAVHVRERLCPQDAGDSALMAALHQLDWLGEALTALRPEDVERHRIPGRLQALTAKLPGTRQSAPDEQLADDASLGDVLDFIDKELGLS